MQKTFILPRAVTALHHTLTTRGITNKNVLLGFNTGQIFALDLRAIDPRRPINQPTPSEKEEVIKSLTAGINVMCLVGFIHVQSIYSYHSNKYGIVQYYIAKN